MHRLAVIVVGMEGEFMSELINNREYRQQQLKEIIKDLHRGKPADEVKERFRTLIKDVGATEISQLEQRLIEEGLPEEEIKKLCDVHVRIFRDALDQQPDPEHIPGHPLHTFRLENAAIEQVTEQIRRVLNEIENGGEPVEPHISEWKRLHAKLREVEKHYSRKENILFPYLEKNGISGPPSVMWSIHDDIRAGLKKTSKLLENGQVAELRGQIEAVVLPTLQAIDEMVYKENNILFPMCLETLSEDEWKEIYGQSDEIGYALVTPERKWEPVHSSEVEEAKEKAQDPHGYLELSTGILTLKEIELVFNHLPVDITFVDADNTVRYFSQGAERIFPRTKAIIGRKVENCHPPESVHVVTKIVEEFREGKRESADFWIRMKGQLIYIRYFAVRDGDGTYRGVVEVTQNVTGIQQLEGEKRLLD